MAASIDIAQAANDAKQFMLSMMVIGFNNAKDGAEATTRVKGVNVFTTQPDKIREA